MSFLGSRFPDGFDLVIMGFGFLSYVRYSTVLPALVPGGAAGGVVKHLRKDGRLLFSVYNELSLAYDVVARLDYSNEDVAIAALMDLSTGFLKVGRNRYFACEAFSSARMMRLLRQSGLVVDEEDVRTFPTLHLAARNTIANREWPADPDFSPGCFSPSQYALDVSLSQVLCDRGHYILGVARCDLTR
jgi:hypothetical protein